MLRVMPEVVEDLADLPLNSHCLSLHVGKEEAAEHAAEFLAGARKWQASAYWVPDVDTSESCTRKVTEIAPERASSVAVLPHEQVEFTAGTLRPATEIRRFIESHPEGVTAAGETITRYWTSGTIPEHLEYESWFDQQPRDRSRFLCPYDLRMIPPHLAPAVLRDLGSHHTHVALSAATDPTAQLLQLFVFSTTHDLPAAMLATFEEALEAGLLAVNGPAGEFDLTPKGGAWVQRWSDRIVARVGARRPAAAGRAA
jgi:hypothetical protein